MPYRITGEQRAVAKKFQTDTQETKLLAPVPKVIYSVHSVPSSLVEPSKVASQNGRTKVASVKRLGNVGRAELDQHASTVTGLPVAAPSVALATAAGLRENAS